MIANSFPRSTAPHMPTLADSLRPLLSLASAGSFHVRYDGTNVIIEQGGWTGVDLAAVQAAVTAAPEASDKLDAKAYLKSLSVYEKASLSLLLKQINALRTKTGLATITLAQYVTALENEIDSLS